MEHPSPRALAALVFSLHAGLAAAALDLAGMDRSTDPCQDFYQFANRKWMEATQIPADRTSWSTFAVVDANNEKILEAALEEALRVKPEAGSAKRKAIDFFASGMDLEAIEKAGTEPVAALMQRIDALQGPAELAPLLAELHSRGIRGGFRFGVRQDAKDSSRYLAEIGQGGLGLPDRDYYFQDDARSRQQREAYLAHVARMLELHGAPAAQAAADAKAIFELEAQLAKAAKKRAELRDPEKNYNRQPRAALEKSAPEFPWAAYFKAIGAEGATEVNVQQPQFAAEFARLAKATPAATWRAYLRWHVLQDVGDKLRAAFADERFAFDERLLKGRQARPPRMREVLEIAAGTRGSEPMGQAFGQLFVERAFPPQAKARALELVQNVKAALAERLRTLDWMGPETRARALEKLSAMQVKIGYPDRWRDYADADVGLHGFAENWMNAKRFEMRRQVRRLGQPVDRTEWWMGPQAVNAYYNGSNNEIVFPAGILQPPFFDAKADDAVNYGGIGMVIGHEITHGFDDRGRKFDAQGNLRDWWTQADARRYEEHAQRIARQYSAFEGPEGLKVNGQLTLGENISDLGGLRIAYLALHKALAAHPQGPVDGLSPEQRFFLSFAHIWRSRMRPEQERLRILTDGHSPPRYRVRGPLVHMPEFARAFSCDPSRTLMTEGERATIW